jgi:hypothetical protein
MIFSIATTGLQDMRLPQWGRAFWQDPNDGAIFLAYGSGTSEVDFITSSNSGVSWSQPQLLFPVENFHIHKNFDTAMDRSGHIHCGFRFNGSGCYQFVGKIQGGSWTLSSGIGPIGLVVAGDSGNLTRGFQGSLTMQETPGFGESAGVSVKIVAKDDQNNIAAFRLNHPYKIAPTADLISGSPNAGASGGFPIIFVPEDETNFVYYNHANSSLNRYEKSFGTYFSFSSVSLGNAPGNVDVPFGPSMAIGSGIGLLGNAGIVLVCGSGQNGVGQGMYASSSTSSYQNVFDVSNNTHLSWLAVTSGNLHGSSSGILSSSGIIPTGNIYGVGPNTFSSSGVTIHNFPGEGTNCDFSFNDAGEFLYYFQKKNEWGKQSIGRFKGSFDGSTWTFPKMTDPASGIKHPASVSQTTTGGWSNTLFWGGFKALKHPTEPRASGNKAELLVTQGHLPIYPSGGILTVWNVLESPALGTWQEPEFSIDYTATSGTAHPIFSGVAAYTNVQVASHYLELPNLFDDTNTTFANVRSGYTLTLELDRVRTIDRIELLQRNTTTSAPGVAVSGTLNGINHTRLFVIPSGRITGATFPQNSSLEKYQASSQTATSSLNTISFQPIFNIDPFVAKFITFQFFNSILGSSRLYEIKLFGPGATNPEIVTWSNATSDPPQYSRLFLTGNNTPREEGFRHKQGTLPLGWRTYGDFEWAIVGSGEATKPVGWKPSDPLPADYDGTVQSGIWSVIFPARGVEDGFSLRSEAIGDSMGLGNPLRTVPLGGIQPGHSATVEVDINLIQKEDDTGLGSPNRSVGFYLRSDIHVDDSVEFYIDGTLQQTYGDFGWITTAGLAANQALYKQRETFTVAGVGSHTLRWVYRKGNYDTPSPSLLYPYGAAWIDGVFGLDSGPLDGAPRNSRHGFLRGVNPFEDNVIHGYLSSFDFSSSSINAYASGSPSITTKINGFLQSRFGLGDQVIKGYTSGIGFDSSIINGYLLGNYAVDPTGVSSSIYGIVNNATPANSLIHGFVQSRFGIGDQIIHGYVSVQSGSYDNSIINGYTLGWDGGVLGLGPNQKAIYGYLSGPLGSGTSSIHGYLLGNYPISSIYGYLGSEALVASGGGLVGNPSTSNVVPGVNFVHGYLKGSIGGQVIHGYVKRPLAAYSNIKGYVLSGKEDMSIHGYARGFENPPSAIHGYASGVGFEASSIYGYVFGISGSISEEIHGYLSATQFPQSKIWGTLIGTALASGLCLSHNFPLPPLLSIILPSGFIN